MTFLNRSEKSHAAPLQALIFDVDGTLAETEEAHRLAFNAAFAAAGTGWDWSRETYRRLLLVTGGKERMAAFAAETGAALAPERIAALHADKTARYAALVAGGAVALRPGVAALLEAARARGLRLAVATTTSRPNVEALCAAAFGRPAAALFDALACGDEVARKKPAPDVWLLALERLGLPAETCLAFEDSAPGLASAKAAGLPVVVTSSLFTEGDDFAGADLVLRDLSAFRLP